MYSSLKQLGKHCSVHHVTVNETADCSVSPAREDVVGTGLLQHDEFFSVDQTESLQVVLGAPFYI